MLSEMVPLKFKIRAYCSEMIENIIGGYANLIGNHCMHLLSSALAIYSSLNK